MNTDRRLLTYNERIIQILKGHYLLIMVTLGQSPNTYKGRRFTTVITVVAVVLLGSLLFTTHRDLGQQKKKIDSLSRSVSSLISVLSSEDHSSVKRDDGETATNDQTSSLIAQISTLYDITDKLSRKIKVSNTITNNFGQCCDAPDVCTQLGIIRRCCDTTNECCSDVNQIVSNVSWSLEQCIPIYNVPISLSGGNCYRLKANFTIAGGVAISIISQYNIDVYFDNHEIVTTAAANPIFISNSTNIKIYNPRLRSPVQRYETNSRGIRVEVNVPLTSSAIFIYKPVIENMRVAMSLVNSDVRVLEPTILGLHAGNGNQATDLQGISANTMTNFYLKGGYISMPYAQQATVDDGLTTCVIVTRVGAVDTGRSSGYIDGLTTENCAIGIDIHRGYAATVKNSRAIVDPKAVFGSAMQVGSGGVINSVTLENIDLNCEADVPTGDCLLFFNVRSVTASHLSIVGTVRPVEGFFRGALLSIGTQAGPSANVFRVESVDLENVAIRATTNYTVAFQVIAGMEAPRNLSVSLRKATIHGGLVGVLLTNSSRNVVLEDVTVSQAPFCFAAVNGSDGVNIENSNAFHCCVCYYADNTTSSIGLYNNVATNCGTSYLDEGTGNEFSVGFGSEGNNRELGETGEQCERPNVIFPPSTISSLAAEKYKQYMLNKYETGYEL